MIGRCSECRERVPISVRVCSPCLAEIRRADAEDGDEDAARAWESLHDAYAERTDGSQYDRRADRRDIEREDAGLLDLDPERFYGSPG
jgi:hypothetical protein